MISVLVDVAPDGGHEARLQAALALVKVHGGHLTCVQIVGATPAPAGSSASVSEVDRLVEDEQEAGEFRESVEAGLDGEGVDWTWLRSYGDPATIMVERSRLADLIVMSAGDSFSPIVNVTRNGRAPVLGIRRRDPDFVPERPALVAWNGSVAAANAVRGAMPMFEAMQPVHILSIDEDDGELPASLVRDYLVAHRVRSEVHSRSSHGERVADAILGFAEEAGAGIIVAGAFGRNRLREMMLGSATRELLDKSSRPLLLAH